MIFCRTNYDCDNLEKFLNSLEGGTGAPFRGKRESGKEHAYSCVVLAGRRSMDQRREALQVCLPFWQLSALLCFACSSCSKHGSCRKYGSCFIVGEDPCLGGWQVVSWKAGAC